MGNVKCALCPSKGKIVNNRVVTIQEANDGKIDVEAPGLKFYMCHNHECHKKLLNYLEEMELVETESKLVLIIDGKKHAFPMDRRVLKGIASKIKEIRGK